MVFHKKIRLKMQTRISFNGKVQIEARQKLNLFNKSCANAKKSLQDTMMYDTKVIDIF